MQCLAAAFPKSLFGSLRTMAIRTTISLPKSPLFDESDLEESFIRGGGNGGQKINKTSNCVQILHKPSGILIKCQETRSLQQNRSIARKRLIEKLDFSANRDESKLGRTIERLRRRKQKQAHRSKKKYSADDDQNDTSESGNEDDVPR